MTGVKGGHEGPTPVKTGSEGRWRVGTQPKRSTEKTGTRLSGGRHREGDTEDVWPTRRCVRSYGRKRVHSRQVLLFGFVVLFSPT